MLKKLLMLLLCCAMIAACVPVCAEEDVTIFFAVDSYEVGADTSQVTVSTYPYDLDIASIQILRRGMPFQGTLPEKDTFTMLVRLQLDSNGNLSDRNGNVVIDFSGQQAVSWNFQFTHGNFVSPEPPDANGQIELWFDLDAPVARHPSFNIQNYEYGRNVTDLVVTEDIPDAELCYHNQIPGWLLYELDTLTPVTSGTLKADTRYMLLVATHYVRPGDDPRGGGVRQYPGITGTINDGKVIFQNFDLSHESFYGFLLEPLKAPAPTPTPVPVPEPPATGDGVRIALCLLAAYLSLNIVSFVRRRQRG